MSSAFSIGPLLQNLLERFKTFKAFKRFKVVNFPDDLNVLNYFGRFKLLWVGFDKGINHG